MFNLPEVSAVRLNVRMSIEEQRKAYDRRQRAWVFFVIGAIVGYVGISGFTAETLTWQAIGLVAFLGGIASVVYGITLFQRPRP